MTKIRLHNSKSRQKEDFKPIDPNNVRIYVCGPTVYDRAHLGNARPAVVFDVLVRLMRHVYGADHVTYVRNFTDVDDKINARAAETGRPISDITNETIGWYLEDMASVGVAEPDHMPRATGYIDQMIAMIETLIAKGHAYAKDGHALFRVRSYEDYGKLSGRSVDDMIAGARVEVAPYKEDPMDFVLWKPSTEDQPGWDSPWGRGRPGWHIECSAMAKDLLGEQFDIHGGGNDLQFPHHENEVAQSCCANESGQFANVWMHNEMLLVEGKKMSKSLGNFFTVRELLDQGVPGEVIRFVLLSTHYGKPMDFSNKAVSDATRTLEKWWALAGDFPRAQSSNVPKKFIAALADDLNTPKAIAELHKMASAKQSAELARAAGLLGFLTPELGGWVKPFEVGPVTKAKVQTLVNIRRNAKDESDYAKADNIRVSLEKIGVELRDSKERTSWRFDRFGAARPLHDELVKLLNENDEEGARDFAASLAGVFRVEVLDFDGLAEDRIHFMIGNSEEELLYLQKVLDRGLSSLLERFQ